jgi:hypothetical protein
VPGLALRRRGLHAPGRRRAVSVHSENGAELVPSWTAGAVHYLAPIAAGPWGGSPVKGIACGTAITISAERRRFTQDFRQVTCDACRMSEPFRARRALNDRDPTCAACGAPLPYRLPPYQPGRAPRYCSSSCRRDASAARAPDPETAERRRHGTAPRGAHNP